MKLPDRVLVAYFRDEHEVLAATHAVRTAGYHIHDVFTPYAVHGMDAAMGLAPSRLTFVCFALGVLGCAGALWLQWWTSAVSWPLNIGGKPLHSLPAFIPVAFEITILFAGLGTVVALFMRARLRPRLAPQVELPGVTNDRFVLAVSATDHTFDVEALRGLCVHHGAERTALLEVPS